MKVLFVASECAPLVKVGGLADVVGSLPKALAALGHDVRVMMPWYGRFRAGELAPGTVAEGLAVPAPGPGERASVRLARPVGAPPLYLVENTHYFGGAEVYGPNELERFLFFSRAAREALPRLDWRPDIVHCHDWHTALLADLLARSGSPHASVLTVHNLNYQGLFDTAFAARTGLERDSGAYPPGAPRPPLSFLAQGILRADLLTTVSPTYAEEVLRPEFGAGLDALLRYRRPDLVGILNGIDVEDFNPETDASLAANYRWPNLDGRAVNKRAVQTEVRLPPDAGTPLIGMVQRLVEQKGFDILLAAADALVRDTGAQVVILGLGGGQYEAALNVLAGRYPGQVAFASGFNERLSRLIYGGCDMFLMPSRFEPCGLGQQIAMHYGALPIVHHTGGLVDTVPSLTPDLKSGRGFIFKEYTPEALLAAVRASVEAFRHNRAGWDGAVRRVMKVDFSWRASARAYERAYRRALRKHRLQNGAGQPQGRRGG